MDEQKSSEKPVFADVYEWANSVMHYMGMMNQMYIEAEKEAGITQRPPMGVMLQGLLEEGYKLNLGAPMQFPELVKSGIEIKQ
jgi:hypothetical protein